MSSNCEKIRDQIADLITGALAETEASTLNEHVRECSACSVYAEALRKEDEDLSGLFAGYDARMREGQAQVVSTISSVEISRQAGFFSAGKTAVKYLLAKHAAAAAVIVVVTLYFVITFSWISQINECIRHCL